MADTEAQQEAQIAHYRDVFNQMDLNSDGELDDYELQREMDNLQAQRRASTWPEACPASIFCSMRSHHSSMLPIPAF